MAKRRPHRHPCEPLDLLVSVDVWILSQMLYCTVSAGRALPPGATLAADQWPPGCLGFAVNLMRPALPSTRNSLMFSQVSIGAVQLLDSL